MTHFSSSTALHNAQATVPGHRPGSALLACIEQHRATFQGQRVLITGASGFLGGHLTRALHHTGAIVTALDNPVWTSRDCFLDAPGWREEITMIEADSSDRRDMADLIIHGRFSLIFHLADAPASALLSAARLLPHDKQPLVIHAARNPIPVDEEHYGAGIIGLRLCHLFGPSDLDFEHLIPHALRNIFSYGESPELSMAAMEEFHDYLYVEDAVRALMSLANCPNCRGQLFELPGAHYGATPDVLREIVSQVSELQDESALIDPRCALAKHHWNRSIRIVPSRPDFEAHSSPRHDGSRLYEATGFEPATPFREALQLTAQFYAWYFSQIVLPKPRTRFGVPQLVHHQRSEPAFETVYTDDGLPVHVLNPHAHVRDKGASRAEQQRPRAFIIESVLPSN